MSSSEMLKLIKFICHIIGHSIPREIECWNLLTMLKSIVEILVSPIIHVQTPKLLATLITEYLMLYSEIFPGLLKPKHHFLFHYPRIMEAVGPVWKVNCIRLEATHRMGKVTSLAAISRVNVWHTIALKHQLILNYRLLCQELSNKVLTFGQQKKTSFEQLPRLDEFHHLIWMSFSTHLLTIDIHIYDILHVFKSDKNNVLRQF